MKEISWTDLVRNELLQNVKEVKNILHIVQRRKANWIDDSLCRYCVPKHIIEGKDTSDEKTKKKT